MELFKTIASSLLMPFQLGLAILVLGCLLCFLGKKKVPGSCCVLLGLILLILPATGPVADRLLLPLEQQHTPILSLDDLPGNIALDSIDWIVVLGGGHRADSNVPPGARLTPSTLSRITEGVRLHKLLPHTMLLLCGGEKDVPGTDAKVMADVALSLGVAPHLILLEDASQNTAAQAVAVKTLAGGDQMLLVTSASHMPRAAALFRSQGLAPVPAPTDFLAAPAHGQTVSSRLPSLANMKKSHRAVYERLATAWARLRGEITNE